MIALAYGCSSSKFKRTFLLDKRNTAQRITPLNMNEWQWNANSIRLFWRFCAGATRSRVSKINR